MSNTRTRGIRIEVESRYEKARSTPGAGSFFFSYHVRVSNEGDALVQLLSRLWIITDDFGNVRRVEGPGVVGETPILAPGESFEYTSFCPLETAFGTMEGHYVMAIVDTQEQFEALIDPFALAAPGEVN